MLSKTAPRSLLGTYRRMCRKDRECMIRASVRRKSQRYARWWRHIMQASGWDNKSLAFKAKWNAILQPESKP